MSTGRFILKCLTMLWIYLCIYSSLPVLYRDIYDMYYRRTMNLILAKRFNVPWCGKLCWNIFTLYTSFWFLRKSGILIIDPLLCSSMQRNQNRLLCSFCLPPLYLHSCRRWSLENLVTLTSKQPPTHLVLWCLELLTWL